MKGECKLCGLNKELKESHIIPKFITDWIKKTSTTGFLRQAVNSNKRIQDGVKEYMLCSDCEIIFSKYEDYFSKKWFYPYTENKLKELDYNINLKKFIISVSWRILAHSLGDFEINNPKIGKYAREAYNIWKDCLLGKRQDILEYKTHLFIFEYVISSTSNLPSKFQFYTLRGIDGTIYYNQELIHVYVKFPGFILFSTIHPTNPDGWVNTEIFDSGALITPQEIFYAGFGDFFKGRAELISKNPVSYIQQRKLNETILKDKNRFINSKSYEVWSEENKRIG